MLPVFTLGATAFSGYSSKGQISPGLPLLSRMDATRFVRGFEFGYVLLRLTVTDIVYVNSVCAARLRALFPRHVPHGTRLLVSFA